MNNNNNQADQASKTGKIMITGAWIALLVICYLFFKMRDMNSSGINNSKSRINSNGSVILEVPLSKNNRYEVFGRINNYDVKFLIDTGATSTAIPAQVAKDANLEQGMPIKSVTAGGETTAYITTIEKLSIGNNSDPNKNIILDDIIATINPSMVDDYVLLGMGALKHLGIKQANNTLILEKP